MSILDGTERDEITRHRCTAPNAHDRRRRIGSTYRCACGTHYRLECTRFGLMWLPTSSTAPLIVSPGHRPPGRHSQNPQSGIDYFVEIGR